MFGLATATRVLKEVTRDVRAARDRDPAARGASSVEILAAWPGVHALLAHRVAHALHDVGIPLAPRAIAHAARTLTGVEIHPAAEVGDGLFIDHGSGVVIGETAEIGENVTIYQGVTLGGTGFATGKRHPTVEDNVTIGSGAKLLGPITGRPRLEDRRQRGRHPRRPAELDGRRQPRPPGPRRGPPRPRDRTPTGSTCPIRSPTRCAACRPGSPRSRRPSSGPRARIRPPTSCRSGPAAGRIRPAAELDERTRLPVSIGVVPCPPSDSRVLQILGGGAAIHRGRDPSGGGSRPFFLSA